MKYRNRRKKALSVMKLIIKINEQKEIKICIEHKYTNFCHMNNGIKIIIMLKCLPSYECEKWIKKCRKYWIINKCKKWIYGELKRLDKLQI